MKVSTKLPAIWGIKNVTNAEEEETTVGKFYGGKVAELSLKGGFRFELVERELEAQVWGRDISQKQQLLNT